MDKIIDENLVLEKYNELCTVREVAKFFKKRASTISNILRKQGINTIINRRGYKVNSITNEKICVKCLIPKSLDLFWLKPNGKYNSWCRKCQSDHRIIYAKKRYKDDSEYRKKTIEDQKKYRENKKNDPDYKKMASRTRKEWVKKNRDKLRKKSKDNYKKYYEKYKEYYKAKSKSRHRQKWDNDPNYRETILNRSKERFEKNYYSSEEYKKNCIKKAVEYNKNRCKTDELFNFITKIRKSIHSSLKKNGYTKKSKTSIILGAEWSVVKNYIESQFSEGMTWENYGEWVFDHKLPISLAKSEEDVIKLNHYTNFQPLWFEDNLKKSNKVYDEFKGLLIELNIGDSKI